jgi:prophage regulatory protein
MSQANPSTSNDQRLLRLPEVCGLVGLGKSSIYEGVKAGTFPAPVKLSRRAVCWPSSKIQQWIEERINSSQKA